MTRPAYKLLVPLLPLILGVTGCTTLAADEQSDRTHFEMLEPDSNLGQTFVSQYDGLVGISVYLDPHMPSNGDITLPGGLTDTYTIHIIQDNEKPKINFIVPRTNQQVTTGPITLTVDASDTISGISHVTFFWHPADWKDLNWTFLGEDWDGSDGWKMNIDIPVSEDPSKIAFYVRAYDRAGNVSGTAYWNNQGSTIYLP